MECDLIADKEMSTHRLPDLLKDLVPVDILRVGGATQYVIHVMPRNTHAMFYLIRMIHMDLLSLAERAEEDMNIMDRAGAPQHIAPVIVFLCGEGSTWIRGVNIPCDGNKNSHIMCEMNGLK